MKNALWDRVALLFGAILLMLLVWWGVSEYFGDEGVRFSMLAVGVLIVFGVVFGSFAVAVRMVTAVHNNTINGIVDFQAADDRGEVARAKVYQEIMRGDRDTMKIAANFGREQAKAIAAAERATWEIEQRPTPALTYNADAWDVVPTVGMGSEYNVAD